MALLAIASVLVFVGLFAFLGTTALAESTQASLRDRVVLAQNTARHIDYVLSSIESVMTDPEARACWLTWEQAASSVDCAYHRLDFYASHAILVDNTGRVISSVPPLSTPFSFSDYASVQAVLNGSPFAVSRYWRGLDGDSNSALAVAPVQDQAGVQRGALIIAIDLAGPGIRTFSGPMDLGSTGYMDLVDLGGTVMASTLPARVGQEADHDHTLSQLIVMHRQTVSACHNCHEQDSAPPPTREILAFAALDQAPWGIAVRQSEDEVFAGTRTLQMRIFVLLAIALLTAALLVYLSTTSVLRPIRSLTTAAERIATGDLETPIPARGTDELGTLAHSFDNMRSQLRDSIAEIRQWNQELEERVQDRTAQCKAAAQQIGILYEELKEKEEARKGLLYRMLSVQEDERKRISRELHDETCQILMTLAFGLENVGEMLSDQASTAEIRAQLDRLRALAKSGRDEVNRLIFDLRPMMLDHLGLVAALRWYAEMRFNGSDIDFTACENGAYLRGSPVVETTLFRVGQEAINNIAQHSQARHANISFDYSDGFIAICISDDGIGFDPASVGHRQGRPGLGIIGMEERVSGLGGELELHSAPGQGTIIRLKVSKNGNGSA